MKSFTHFQDFSPLEIQALVERALTIKQGKYRPNFQGKILGMLFLNPSLRTRVSFETAMWRFGGHAISLSGNSDVWALEFQAGAVMDGHSVEHVKDAAQVLGRLCDAIAIRSFAGMNSLAKDLADEVITNFKKYAGKPVISMESAVEHPCQALADMLTIKERLHEVKQKKLVVTWAPHIKPLPLAVPHSAVLAGVYAGMHVTLAHPAGFELAPNYLHHAAAIAQQTGGSFSVTQKQKIACADAEVIYAKAWGATSHYGDKSWHDQHLAQLRDWQVDYKLCQQAKLLLHCLPVRRNLEVADDALDSEKSVIYDEAENRFWAQSAVLDQFI